MFLCMRVCWCGVTINSKCPKLFGKRPHRRLVTCRGGQYIRLPRAFGHAHSPCVGTLQWAGTYPLKSVPPSVGGWVLPSNTIQFLGPTWVSPRGISICSAVFAQLIRVPNTSTDTQTTPRATSVAIGRSMHCLQTMRPKNTTTRKVDLNIDTTIRS